MSHILSFELRPRSHSLYLSNSKPERVRVKQVAKTFLAKDPEEEWRQAIPRSHVRTLDCILSVLRTSMWSKAADRAVNHKLKTLIAAIPDTPTKLPSLTPVRHREERKGRIRLRDLQIRPWRVRNNSTPLRRHIAL